MATTIVTTATGQVEGRLSDGIASDGIASDGIRVFRGIPYGASTSGANRFRPPQPVEAWTGVREAHRYGETAPQMRSRLSIGGPRDDIAPIGEDCLVLNVWTPGTDAAKRPVMVWLHGGGFEAGTGSSLLYDATRVARRGDVVVVTVNHRLGVMGHCHLDEILGEDFAGSANVGFLDIVAALRWVRENIAGFGGDPGNVMIYGQSGGGRKVSLATASTDAKGLFHKGIVQSGSHLRLLDADRANTLAERLLAELDIPLSAARTLQDRPMQDVLDAARALRSRFSPTIDGVVFDGHPWDPGAPATAFDVPMIIGTCRTELSNQLGSMDPTTFDIVDEDLPARLERFVGDGGDDAVDEIVSIVRRSNPSASPSEVLFTVATVRGYWHDSVLQTERKAEQAAEGGAPVWSYRLMWHTPVEGGRRITPHSLDLPFVFDNVPTTDHMVGPETDETATMTDSICESWLAFARTSDPNNGSIPEWAPYDLDRRAVMHFDAPPVAIDDPHRDERLFMQRFPSQQERGGVIHRRSA